MTPAVDTAAKSALTAVIWCSRVLNYSTGYQKIRVSRVQVIQHQMYGKLGTFSRDQKNSPGKQRIRVIRVC